MHRLGKEVSAVLGSFWFNFSVCYVHQCALCSWLMILISFKQASSSSRSLSLERTPALSVLHVVEGLALVVLCSCRPATRRLAVNVLKEVRALHTALGIGKVIILDLQCILL